MGEAKRRGSFEIRKEQAIKKNGIKNENKRDIFTLDESPGITLNYLRLLLGQVFYPLNNNLYLIKKKGE